MRTCHYLIRAELSRSTGYRSRKVQVFEIKRELYKKGKKSSEKEKCSYSILFLFSGVGPLRALPSSSTPFDANKNLSSGGC